MSDAEHLEPELIPTLKAAVAAADWDAVIAIVERNWSELLTVDPVEMRTAVYALPADFLEKHPRWVTARNYLDYVPIGDDEVRPVRYREAPIPSPSVGLLDALVALTSRCAARRSSGQFYRAAENVDEAREVLAEANDDSVVSIQQSLPDLHFQWGMAREFAGQESQAMEEYQDAYDLAAITGNNLIVTNSAGSLAWLHTLAGRTEDAERWLARIPRDQKQGWHSKRYAMTANLARVLSHLDRLEFSRAQAILNDDVDVTKSPEYWAAALMLESRVAAETRDPRLQLSEIDAAVASRPEALSTSGLNSVYLALARSELHLVLDQTLRARKALEEPETARPSQLRRLAQAQVELLSGNLPEVARLVDPLLTTAHPRVLAEALYLQAIVRFRGNRSAEAAGYFRQALRIVTEQGLAGVLTIAPRRDLDELVALPGVDIDAALLDRVIADGRFLSAPGTFAPLSPKEQSVLALLITGVPTAEIASRLFVSQNTVKTQLRSVYRKLGVANRVEAEAAARRHGIID